MRTEAIKHGNVSRNVEMIELTTNRANFWSNTNDISTLDDDRKTAGTN